MKDFILKINDSYEVSLTDGLFGRKHKIVISIDGGSDNLASIPLTLGEAYLLYGGLKNRLDYVMKMTIDRKGKLKSDYR